MESATAQILMRCGYETYYGIYQHSAQSTNPLDRVLVHPSEDVSSNSRFEKAIRMFAEADVYNQTGIDLIKAMELPTYRFKELCVISKKIAEEKAKAGNSIMQDIARAKG